LARWDADSVFLDNGVALSLGSAVRFEVQRREAIGAGIGALLGIPGGALCGFTVAGFVELASWSEETKPCGETTCFWRYTAVGAGAGVVLGAVLGAIRFPYWEEVPFDGLRVSLVPQRDGRFAFGASVRF
jgi:hypothetical protein